MHGMDEAAVDSAEWNREILVFALVLVRLYCRTQIDIMKTFYLAQYSVRPHHLRYHTIDVAEA